MGRGVGGAVSKELEDLRDAVIRLCTTGEDPEVGCELRDQFLHLSQSMDMLRLEQARRAKILSESKEWERDGFNTDTDYIRVTAHMSRSDAARLLTVGDHLHQLPQSQAAVDRGEIGFGHLLHMAYNAEFIAYHKTGVFNEAPLLVRALDESVGLFRRTAVNMRHVQDPKGVVANEVNAVEMREVSFSPHEDGTTFIGLLVDSPTAAAIKADMETRATRLGPDDHRSRTRREADALIERLLGKGGPATQVNVCCTAETLMGLPGAPAAELDYTEPISGEMLRRLACDAAFTKILLDDKLIPVAASHSKRMPTAKERQAIDVAQKTCRGRGCHRPARQCTPHHVFWYSKYRRTKTTEIVLLCAHHHWMVHEGGWDVALKDDGDIVFIPPFARRPTGIVAGWRDAQPRLPRGVTDTREQPAPPIPSGFYPAPL